MSEATKTSPADRADGEDIALRQCGRCRQSFPGDPDLHRVALPEWWLCPPCREALLGKPGPQTVSGPSNVRMSAC